MQAAGTLFCPGRSWALSLRVLILGLLLPFLIQPALAEEAYQIKAAFIFNFTKFVDWPKEMEQAGGDLRLCIVGGNPFGDYIFQLNGRKVRNFFLRVHLAAPDDDLSHCHILFLSQTTSNQKLLGRLADSPVLTIGDYEDFLKDGGGIRLFSEDNRIRFDVNLPRIKGSDLDISSKLLHLARQVM